MDETECATIIQQAWSQGRRYGSVEDIMQLINNCGSRLKQGNMIGFGHVQQRIVMVEKALTQVQERYLEVINCKEIKEARKEVQLWLEREEML